MMLASLHNILDNVKFATHKTWALARQDLSRYGQVEVLFPDASLLLHPKRVTLQVQYGTRTYKLSTSMPTSKIADYPPEVRRIVNFWVVDYAHYGSIPNVAYWVARSLEGRKQRLLERFRVNYETRPVNFHATHVLCQIFLAKLQCSKAAKWVGPCDPYIHWDITLASMLECTELWGAL